MNTYVLVALSWATLSILFLWAWSLIATAGRPFRNMDDAMFIGGVSLGILVLSFLWPVVIIAMLVLFYLAIRS